MFASFVGVVLGSIVYRFLNPFGFPFCTRFQILCFAVASCLGVQLWLAISMDVASMLDALAPQQVMFSFGETWFS